MCHSPAQEPSLTFFLLRTSKLLDVAQRPSATGPACDSASPPSAPLPTFSDPSAPWPRKRHVLHPLTPVLPVSHALFSAHLFYYSFYLFIYLFQLHLSLPVFRRPTRAVSSKPVRHLIHCHLDLPLKFMTSIASFLQIALKASFRKRSLALLSIIGSSHPKIYSHRKATNPNTAPCRVLGHRCWKRTRYTGRGRL